MNYQAEPGQTGDDPAESAVLISALMDGALSGSEIEAALAAAAQPDGQARWQMYCQIGDALRASELAVHSDPGLLTRVRAALQEAPATLTPEPPALPMPQREAANDGVFRWKMVSGFVSVVAVVAIGWNLWGGGVGIPSPGRQGQQLASAGAIVQPAQMSQAAATGSAAGYSSAEPQAGAQLAVVDDEEDGSPAMLRDPQLDRLLAEHRQMTAFGRPSAFLRNATFVQEPAR